MRGLVKYFSILGKTRQGDGVPFLCIRGEAAWDTEHGVSLFFEEGKRLAKVGDLNDPLP